VSANNIPSYAIPVVGFNSRKAAQTCAFFALKAGGHIEKLKLIKLIYFCERKHIADHHMPMLWDEFYSLPHGPICSSTLNGIDGIIHEDIWSDFIARNGNIVVAIKKFKRPEFDEISNADLKTLEAIWAEFGRFTASQLRNYSHKNCSEYTEVESGRVPISYKDVLEALGDEDAEMVEREIKSLRKAESALMS
jgi:uncharacterized phage-associated protein